MVEAKQDSLIVFDTTLRDGEQSAGAGLNVEKKLRIAQQLDALGVDVIEAGFAASSPEDFESVKRVAKEVRTPIICSLARALPKDIEQAAKALESAEHPRIHTFISSSDIHLMHQLKSDRETIIGMAVDAVRKAKTYFDDVEFSPMDATRTELQYLYQLLEATIAEGATTVNIPDTVGYSNPTEFGALIRGIIKNVSNISEAIISVHCHNDLGMATANSLAGLENGARQVEGCINGLGERAGNAALEEVIMAVNTRQDHYNLRTRINTKKIGPVSRLVSSIFDFPVQYNKAIVGRNSFKHSSGIHQDAYLKEKQTFEIMKPEDVGYGWGSRVIDLDKLSGRAGLRAITRELGYNLSDEQLNKVFVEFKILADSQTEVTYDDLVALFRELGYDNLSYEQLNEIFEAFKTLADIKTEVTYDDLVAFVNGQHGSAGRTGIKARLRAIGYNLSDEQLNEVFVAFKTLADTKTEVTYDDLVELMNKQQTIVVQLHGYEIKDIRIESGTHVKPAAEVSLTKPDGSPQTATSSGTGPTDAVFGAINKIVGYDSIRLTEFVIKAVTGGIDAVGEVNVSIRKDNITYSGHGEDNDIILAAGKAYINSINKWLITRDGIEVKDANTEAPINQHHRSVQSKFSDEKALMEHLRTLGYNVSREQLNEVFAEFKSLADTKADVTDDDLEALMNQQQTLEDIPQEYKIDFIRVINGTQLKSSAEVSLIKPDGSPQKATTKGGTGPIDAVFSAINKIVGSESIKLTEFLVKAVTASTDSIGEVKVRILKGNRLYSGLGYDTNIIVAASKAYVNAINKWFITKDKTEATDDKQNAL